MDLNKNNTKAIKGLVLFTAFVCLGVIYIKEVFMGLLFVVDISKPFLIGGAIAFVVNIPMGAIERKVFSNEKNKLYKFRRPLSLVLSLIAIVAIVLFVFLTVVPQLTKTFVDLGYQIPEFVEDVITKIEHLFVSNPGILKELEKLQDIELNWNSIATNVGNFLKNGVGSIMRTSMNVASSFVSGLVNILVAFIFSIYILSQKEKLGDQFRRVCCAYLPEKMKDGVMKVSSLLHRNFTKFITGQCLEAVILGTMFFLTMSLFKFPYALLVGVLIAFTALIPIVGAFIGCFVGAFLIMIDNPVMAVGFVILFLVLQQVEGNLIYPYVVGNSVGLPSIWVLVAVSIGGSLMGVIGMLVFIPLLSTVYALVRENVNKRNTKIRKK